MTKDYRGKADPASSLALLWRTRDPVHREGRTDLSAEKIARAAIGIADTEGLPALTMRRVSEVLGVGTMSSYTYVKGKGELIALMMDTVYAETPRPDDHDVDWRTRLDRIARNNWALHRNHPWLARVESSRPVLGPNLLAKYDYELRALAGTGLSAVEMDSVLTLILGHVRSAARDAADVADLVRDTGMTDEQWWQAQQPWLAKYAQQADVAMADEVGTAAGAEHNAAYDPDHAFEFGLSRLLDGVAALVAEQSART